MIKTSPYLLIALCNRVAQGFAIGAIWLAGLGLSLLANAEPLTVRVSGISTVNVNDPYYYYTQMLILALEKTRQTDGDFAIAYQGYGGGIERDRSMLVAGVGIDVMWASVTKERAKKLRVIDVDLLKGLNNYRALLIHKNAQARFDKVKTLEDLKTFKAGAGHYWTDGLIMKSNGFTVVYGANYAGLFRMLSVNRYDFISRGLHEIGNDLVVFEELGLVQDRNFLLHYDEPVRYCFFVNKNNKNLADRIERGLKIAQADGSFDRLFMQMPMLKFGYDFLQSNQYRIFKIHNGTNR